MIYSHSFAVLRGLQQHSCLSGTVVFKVYQETDILNILKCFQAQKDRLCDPPLCGHLGHGNRCRSGVRLMPITSEKWCVHVWSSADAESRKLARLDGPRPRANAKRRATHVAALLGPWASTQQFPASVLRVKETVGMSRRLQCACHESECLEGTVCWPLCCCMNPAFYESVHEHVQSCRPERPHCSP